MNKKAMWAEVLIFLTFIFGFFIANLAVPDARCPNRRTNPSSSCPSSASRPFSDKTFTKQFEDYTSDQFVLRDQWITLKARPSLPSARRR